MSGFGDTLDCEPRNAKTGLNVMEITCSTSELLLECTEHSYPNLCQTCPVCPANFGEPLHIQDCPESLLNPYLVKPILT